MPLFQYLGWVGSFLLAGLFAASWWFSGHVADAPPFRAPPSEGIQIRIHSDHKWPERVVFDTAWPGLAPPEKAAAETGPQDDEAGQESAAAGRHDPVEAFAQMRREALGGCLQSPCRVDHDPESAPAPKRKAAPLRSHPAPSRAARAFTVPNRFHRLPGKS